METTTYCGTVFIMRGLPGTGKSTIARFLTGCCGGIIHSTDEFFMVGQEYRFDPTKLPEYHAQNLANFCRSLEKRIPVVVCDNTNFQKRHFAPYVEAAKKEGYQVVFVSMPHLPLEEAARRNTHGVSAVTIASMMRRWESEQATDAPGRQTTPS